MDQTEKLLQSVVENARTGVNACEQLIERTDDGDLRGELRNLRDGYQSFERAAERALYDAGAHPAPEPAMDRAGMWLGIRMNTMMDATPSHIAEIAIQGATMGIVEMTKDSGDLTGVSDAARKIAGDFVAGQQKSIDRLKKYL